MAPLEQSQAQLIINVYPRQDNPTTQTLWIFGGSSTSRSASVQSRNFSAANFDNQDSRQENDNNGNILDANKPSNANFQLSPLFSRTNAIDIEFI